MIHQQLSHAVLSFLAEVERNLLVWLFSLEHCCVFSHNLSRRVRTGRLRHRINEEADIRTESRRCQRAIEDSNLRDELPPRGSRRLHRAIEATDVHAEPRPRGS
jgi:hypothetical protein